MGEWPVQFLLRIAAMQNRNADFVTIMERVVFGNIDETVGQGKMVKQCLGFFAQVTVLGTEKRESWRHDSNVKNKENFTRMPRFARYFLKIAVC
jgi:hypothetical protein